MGACITRISRSQREATQAPRARLATARPADERTRVRWRRAPREEHHAAHDTICCRTHPPPALSGVRGTCRGSPIHRPGHAGVINRQGALRQRCSVDTVGWVLRCVRIRASHRHFSNRGVTARASKDGANRGCFAVRGKASFKGTHGPGAAVSGRAKGSDLANLSAATFASIHLTDPFRADSTLRFLTPDSDFS